MLVLTKRALRYIVDFYIYDPGRRFNQGPFELAGHITFDLNRNDGRAAHCVRLTRIDGSVRRAPSPYRLGMSQLSRRTVDVREKAVCFLQMTGVNGVDHRHGKVHGF